MGLEQTPKAVCSKAFGLHPLASLSPLPERDDCEDKHDDGDRDRDQTTRYQNRSRGIPRWLGEQLTDSPGDEEQRDDAVSSESERCPRLPSPDHQEGEE